MDANLAGKEGGVPLQTLQEGKLGTTATLHSLAEKEGWYHCKKRKVGTYHCKHCIANIAEKEGGIPL